jgi:nicotinic acetylcholine receptor
MCQMNVRWFPFDIQVRQLHIDEQYWVICQECELKFGSWTYDGNEVNLEHYNKSEEHWDTVKKVARVNQSIDIHDFAPSAEWDVMNVPSERECHPLPPT